MNDKNEITIIKREMQHECMGLNVSIVLDSSIRLEIVSGSSLNPLYLLPCALPHVEQAVEVPLVAIHRSKSNLADKTLELWEHCPTPFVFVPLLPLNRHNLLRLPEDRQPLVHSLLDPAMLLPRQVLVEPALIRHVHVALPAAVTPHVAVYHVLLIQHALGEQLLWSRGRAGSLALTAVEDGATLRHLFGLGRLALRSDTTQGNDQANGHGLN